MSSCAAPARCRSPAIPSGSSEGDLILVPPATDHSIANDGEAELACVSVQSPPVAVAELYGGQMAEVSGYDDDEDL